MWQRSIQQRHGDAFKQGREIRMARKFKDKDNSEQNRREKVKKKKY